MIHHANSGRFRRRLLAAVAVGALTGLSLGAGAAEAAIASPQAGQTRDADNPAGLRDLLVKAKQAIQQGHPNVAVIYLKNAAALAPKNVDVRLELGFAYLQSGNATASVRELRTARDNGAPDARVLPLLYQAMLVHKEGQQLLDQFPEPPPSDKSPLAAATLRARGVAQIQLGHPELAALSLDRALAISRDVQNLMSRAELANDQHDVDLALKLADEAYAKAPRDPAVLLLRISLLQKANRAAEALPVADTLVKLNGDNPLSYLARAGVLLQMGQDAKARADVDTLLHRWQNLPQAMYLRAMILARAKDSKGAWAVAQALPPEFVNSRPEVAAIVAQLALSSGHNDVGLTILSNAVSRFPDTAEPRIQLASTYLRMKNAQRALDTLLPVRDSQEPRIMVLLGQAYAMQKDTAKATEYFEKAHASGFGGDLLQRQIAASNLSSGDTTAAIKDLRDLNARQPGDAVTAGLLITALMRTNDVAGATQVADKLAASDPKSPYGPLFLGQILLVKQDANGAIAAFSRAAAIDSKFVPALYDRALARAAAGDLNGANADVDAVLKIDPKNVTAMIRSAEIAIRMNQSPRAEAILKRAVEIDPKNAMPNLALANFYLNNKRMNDADAVTTAYLKRVPTDLNAQVVQAEVQAAAGKLDAAVAGFKRLAGAHPDSAQIQLMLGTALAAKKDTGGAVAAYKRAVQLSPKMSVARSTLVRYALATNNQAAALAAAKDGVTQDPGAVSDVLLASTFVALKKPDQAETTLKQSLAKTPSEAAAILLSQVYRAAKRDKQADAVLSGWIAKHPSDIGARLEYAQQQMGARPAVAEEQFRAIVKLQPGNTIALNNLSWLLQKKAPKEAVSFAEQAAKLAPNSPEVLDTLGWVKWQAKDALAALPILQKAHAADTGNPEITYHLAIVLDGTGHRAEAKKTLGDLLASKQDFTERGEAEALSVRWR